VGGGGGGMVGTGMGASWPAPLADGAGSGCVLRTGGGVADAGFTEGGANDGGGLQPVCSCSQSLERPPQPTVAAVNAATAASAVPGRPRARPDATPSRFVIDME
jgi:hypothetical protein